MNLFVLDLIMTNYQYVGLWAYVEVVLYFLWLIYTDVSEWAEQICTYKCHTERQWRKEQMRMGDEDNLL